jgi:large subunit ribosomal protein L11
VSRSGRRAREVAQLPDLNTTDLDAVERIVAGTARSMGIAIG